jgi:hypothetical protein
MFGANFNTRPIRVRHSDLGVLSKDSRYKRQCPQCSTGILAVRRNETLRLMAEDMCMECGQVVVYEDIKELRLAEGEIPLDILWITQHKLRDEHQIPQMIKYVNNGGFWTLRAIQEFSKAHGQNGAAIVLNRFPDGMWIIHDGHHRIVSTFLGGRDYLRVDEYSETNRPYEDYLYPNFDGGFYTPFDPLKEVRLNDFNEYKEEAIRLADKNRAEAMLFVAANRYRYSETRAFHSVAELAKTWGNK